MKVNIEDFKKTKRFLVCVDSDGCAMDTMEVKHRKCFAPKAIEIWGLQDIEAKFLETWNMVNLYSKTRGINRFKGLAKTFELLSEDGIDMPDFSTVNKWIENSTELSNPALEKAISQTKDGQLVKVLEWSNAVNKAITELPEDDKPFPNVKKVLETISCVADVAIVSSANGGAVIAEWTRHELAPFVKVMLGQEAGTKANCIANLKNNKYYEDEVLMIGDALGDLESAMKNDVLFYPILVGREDFSWKRLMYEALTKLLEGSYRGEYQDKLINEFNSILK
ncbi:HAD hydrolase-like protein [Clostridium fungisolvens]|uniref:Phosphoglycolate phosphatase, HAD superfamily n=1 Tax=Clostridium fungisolvens TaxID=1604897 RepID=A0A6V8SC48_9CLOT|nr:HAD hydrolase-like protein [Clostridium fungisolvens]GFP74421.1 hypothetical protein bsdtw1_00471 [Clostridium fungisolvens]